MENLEAVDVDLGSSEEDTRWQAAITLGTFCEDDPALVWPLVVKWGSSPEAAVRTAIATCVLEHLLEHHFEAYFPLLEGMVTGGNLELADTFTRCWKIGQAEEPANAAKFDRLEKDAMRMTAK